MTPQEIRGFFWRGSWCFLFINPEEKEFLEGYAYLHKLLFLTISGIYPLKICQVYEEKVIETQNRGRNSQWIRQLESLICTKNQIAPIPNILI